MDPNERDQLLHEPQPGDELPTSLTAFQTLKVASILDAIDRGHEAWGLYLPHVIRLLRAVAMEAKAGPGVTMPSAADIWAELEPLPWPPSGRPKAQR